MCERQGIIQQHRVSLGEWVMGQVDARFGREYSSLGILDRSPAMPALPQRHVGQNDRLPPARPAVSATIGQAELRRVVLVESDQYSREVLTFELLRQGFIVHAFSDGASLLGSLASVVGADLAVLGWDLPKMSGIELLAQLRQHGVNVPVAFLTGKAAASDDQDQCALGLRKALNVAFDQGTVDSSTSRDRQVLVERLKRVVELARPATVAAVEERVACDKLLLKPGTNRAYWRQVDVGLTLGEYKIVHLLVSKAGSFVTYRSLYDRLHFEGFIAGSGNDGFRANVRSAIKRIRNKFRACDPAFDEIENYNGFGYGWRKPD
jgi:two-component system, OmpR family, response regulator ChvI